jgi:hypothetical protein
VACGGQDGGLFHRRVRGGRGLGAAAIRQPVSTV